MIERNRVYNMDCMIGMAQMPDNHIDLAIVDPPYGIGNFSPSSGGAKVMTIKKRAYSWNESIPGDEYFTELRRVSVNRVIWGANYYNVFESGGAIVWDKLKTNPKMSACEIASYSGHNHVDKFTMQWLGLHNPDGETIHPCQKPVDLYRWLIHKYAEEGDLILDTHVGSGSSIIACIDKGFDYIGYEIDADYYKAMQERVYQFTRQTKLLY